MLSFRRSKEDVQDALEARHLDSTPEDAATGQQRVLARWPNRRLRQLQRRFEAAGRAEPGDVLQEKLETIRSS